MRTVSLLAALALMTFMPGTVLADLVLLTNGYTIEAEVLLETDDEIILKAPNGTIVLPRSEVKHIARKPVAKRTNAKKTVEPASEPQSNKNNDAIERDPKGDAAGALMTAKKGPRESNTAAKTRLPGRKVQVGSVTFQLPKSFVSAPASKVPTSVQGAVQIGGEWIEPSTKARASLVSMPVPQGLPASQMSSILFTQIEQKAVSDTRLSFHRGVIEKTPVLFGVHKTTEEGVALVVHSVYFLTDANLEILSVTIPAALDVEDNPYRAVVRSIRSVK